MVFFTDFANVRAVCAFCSEPAILQDSPRTAQRGARVSPTSGVCPPDCRPKVAFRSFFPGRGVDSGQRGDGAPPHPARPQGRRPGDLARIIIIIFIYIRIWPSKLPIFKRENDRQITIAITALESSSSRRVFCESKRSSFNSDRRQSPNAISIRTGWR